MLRQGTRGIERNTSAAVELAGQRMYLKCGNRLVGQAGKHTAQFSQALSRNRPVSGQCGHPDVTGRQRPHRNDCLAVVSHRLPLFSDNSLRLTSGKNGMNLV